MQRSMLKSKIHRATVTDSDLHYVGSITIDPDLLEAADIREFEQVAVVDVDNGALNVTFGNLVNKNIAGKILTLQPLIVPGSPMSPMSWRCGLREVPKGMQAVGTNRTDVDGKFLPTSCRGA